MSSQLPARSRNMMAAAAIAVTLVAAVVFATTDRRHRRVSVLTFASPAATVRFTYVDGASTPPVRASGRYNVARERGSMLIAPFITEIPFDREGAHVPPSLLITQPQLRAVASNVAQDVTTEEPFAYFKRVVQAGMQLVPAGTGSVRGVPTNRYRMEIAGVATIVLDVDHARRIRRIEQRAVAASAAKPGAGVTTLEFYGFS